MNDYIIWIKMKIVKRVFKQWIIIQEMKIRVNINFIIFYIATSISERLSRLERTVSLLTAYSSFLYTFIDFSRQIGNPHQHIIPQQVENSYQDQNPYQDKNPYQVDNSYQIDNSYQVDDSYQVDNSYQINYPYQAGDPNQDVNSYQDGYSYQDNNSYQVKIPPKVGNYHQVGINYHRKWK